MAKDFIAVIDDDASVREAISDLVAVRGFAVDTFDSAESFLGTQSALDASCIIVDVQMPGMSGIELHRQLLAEGRSIPTIFITAFPQKEAWDRLLRQGACGYLGKPIREETLVDCIHRAVAEKDATPDA